MTDIRREEQLRIQAVGAAISRRDWHAVEEAYNAIRDEFDRRALAKPASSPAGGVDAVALADLIDSIAKCHSENAMDQAFLDNSDEIATAVLKLFADRDGEWACTVNRLEDRIEGLNADLESAVEVAFRRGAAEWTRLNYPTLHMRLSDPASLSPARELRPRQIISVNGTWVELQRVQTEIGLGVAETQLWGREFFAGRQVHLAIPLDWQFEVGDADKLLGRKRDDQ